MHKPIKPKAICILGMHRSGTSTVARAINLLGASLGDDGLMPPTPDNPEGYWERLDIVEFQTQLLHQLDRTWDTAAPFPENWHLAPRLAGFRDELKSLVTSQFGGKPLWAWKDPRTCLLLPIWKQALADLGIELVCVFVVRSPLDVAGSLRKRDGIPSSKGFGMWFNHYVTALKDTAGIPRVFVSYDQFLESWETELRPRMSSLGLDWPAEELSLREAMGSFIKPHLRHNKSRAAELEAVPKPVRDLNDVLTNACLHPGRPGKEADLAANQLYSEFVSFASLFVDDLKKPLDKIGNKPRLTGPGFMPQPRPPYLQRTLERWQRSFQKRFAPGRLKQRPQNL